MKNFLFLFMCLMGIFTLSQCNKSVILDDGDPIIIEPSNYSTIAFIGRITDNSAGWSLCIMDKSGDNMRKIVEMTTTCQKPVRSNSGTKLLFITLTPPDYHYELYSVNIDGTGLTLIDNAKNGLIGSPDWSPDDRQIIYVKYSNDNREKSDFIIYDMFNKTHKVLNIEGGEDDKHSPKFSPDGKQIAYCATVKSDTTFIHSHCHHHIYKVDVNGKNNQLIIKDASSPKWSFQGDKIVYSSSGVGGSSQIFVANANGSNQKQLTSTVSPRIWPGWPPDGNGDPQWTLDGKKIVYVSWENERPEIFIMNSDGNNKKRLTTAEFRDESPEITPDGKHILFSSRKSDMMNGIWIMSLDGSNQKVISKTGIYPVACK